MYELPDTTALLPILFRADSTADAPAWTRGTASSDPLPHRFRLSVPAARPPEQVRADVFRELAQCWERDTCFMSDTNRVLAHPACAALIELGSGIVPLILKRGGGVQWFHVLHSITAADPVPHTQWGRVDGMWAYWRRWGRERGVPC